MSIVTNSFPVHDSGHVAVPIHSGGAAETSRAIWDGMSIRWARWSTTEKNLGWAFPSTPLPENALSEKLKSFSPGIAPFRSMAGVFTVAMQAQENIEARKTFTWEHAHIWLWNKLCSSAPIKWLFPDTVREHKQTVSDEALLVASAKRIVVSLSSIDEMRRQYTCWDIRYEKSLVRIINGNLIAPQATRDALADILLGRPDQTYGVVRHGPLVGLMGTPHEMADELERRVARAKDLVSKATSRPPAEEELRLVVHAAADAAETA
ncbi:hypothetical protein ACUSIJ_03385 [Pseudochelatococcus sp. B33]